MPATRSFWSATWATTLLAMMRSAVRPLRAKLLGEAGAEEVDQRLDPLLLRRLGRMPGRVDAKHADTLLLEVLQHVAVVRGDLDDEACRARGHASRSAPARCRASASEDPRRRTRNSNSPRRTSPPAAASPAAAPGCTPGSSRGEAAPAIPCGRAAAIPRARRSAACGRDRGSAEAPDACRRCSCAWPHRRRIPARARRRRL